MSITAEQDKRILPYLLASSIMVLCIPLVAAGQIIIKERMELGRNSSIPSSPKSKVSSGNVSLMSGPSRFTIQSSGPLKIVFEKGRRFSEAFAQQTRLTISVTDSAGRQKHKRKYFPGDFFSDPIQGRMTPECTELWYLYGEGPFDWHSGGTPEAMDDAQVFSLSCSEDYAEQTGTCRTTNFGALRFIGAIAWTWFSDPAVIRSYLRFDGLEFSGPVKLEEARLRLYESGRSSQLSGSNAFLVNRVTSGWDEYTINWNNQPGSGPPQVSGPAGIGNVDLDVTPIVQSWLDNPESNHGFGLVLQNEHHYRNRGFYSSEGQTPPDLRVQVSNPEARSDTLEIAFVEPGDVVTFEYESNGEVFSSNAETITTMNGEPVTGRQLIFNVAGPTCGSQGFSECLQAFAWVDSPPLTISIPEPKEAWPAIPAGGADFNFDFATVENTKEDIEVRLVNNGLPVTGHQVQILADWIPRSGAHDHDGSGDEAPNPRDLGWLVNMATNDSLQGRLTATTDAEGLIRLRYRTPLFGGEVVLRAVATLDGEQLTARDTLEVTVPDLVRLPAGTNYAKVGGTQNHHGPRLDTEDAYYLTPDNNHYGTQAFVDSLIAIADAWQELVLGDSTQDDRQIPLNINDLSLPNGGLFDISGRWRTGHDYHRVGRDADIRTTRSFPINPSVRNGVLLKPVLISGRIRYRNSRFEDLCLQKGAYPRPEVHDEGEDEEHYHVYFYSNN